jgi:hypothetical protein
MAKATPKRLICGTCGVNVRPDTQFCYNCGKSLEGELGDGERALAPEASKSLADLERALAESRPVAVPSRSKREAAAAERRRARSSLRKPVEIAWGPPELGRDLVYPIAALVIFILVLVTVYLTIFSK